MTDTTIQYILDNQSEFCVCLSCEIINKKENDKCWLCKMPMQNYKRDISEEDLTQLKNFRKDMLVLC